MPRSSTARFSEMWQRSTGDDMLLEHIVEKWRLSASGGGAQATQFAEASETASAASDAGYSDDVDASGETAVEVGRYRLTAGDAEADHGKYIVVWKNVDGRWKLHRDIWNTSKGA